MTVLSRGIKHLDKAYLSGVMTLWKETRTLSEKRVLIYCNGALILSLLEMGKVKIQQISKSHFVEKRTAPCESTTEELSFEWSQRTISSTDSKVRTTW